MLNANMSTYLVCMATKTMKSPKHQLMAPAHDKLVHCDYPNLARWNEAFERQVILCDHSLR